ncbi:immunoglobulin lambda-1 light chain-like, partial [Notolabrus celidotus]|uniref:immunoglobulin lambda-1 light chain-like n=1 Tax=Notolabrus celidotus TaxID=1203425 RepID=UPI00148FC654
VFWFQKNDTETFRLILDIHRSNGEIYKGFNHPQKDDFSAVNKQNGWELQIQRVELSHSATYYCSCLKYDPGWYPIFGSGTKLFVTDEPVVKPVVSVYPAVSRAQLEGKSSLLCVASDMFPPLVQISWRRPKGDGQLEVLPPAEGEQLELRESGRTVAIRVINQDAFHTDRYLCSVQHEGGRVDARTEQEVPAAFFISQCRVKLLSLLYSLLILKSLVFCCGLSLLRIPTNKPPSISCTCADRLSPAGLFSPSDLSSSPLESFSQQVQM